MLRFMQWMASPYPGSDHNVMHEFKHERSPGRLRRGHTYEDTEELLIEIASELGLDQKSFKKEMSNPKILSMVQKDLRDGQKAGVRSVPTIFVNGRLLKNRTLKGFRTLIDGELEKLLN